MARQPVALLLALALVACKDDEPYMGAFDEPSAVAVLQLDDSTPFEEPVGYVASGRGGRIATLALKQGRFLTDDPTVSFVRGHFLPTGGKRLLGSVATWAPEPGTVHVLAGDKGYEKLLRVPHVVGLDEDGAPIEPETTVGEPAWEATGSAAVVDLEIKQGFTATEEWTAEYEAGFWWVEGSRSGLQEQRVATGEPFVGDERALAFTVEGEASEGDRFTVSTDSGVVEYDVGGSPLEIAMAPDQSALAMVVHDRDLDRPVLRWWDPVTGEVTEDSPLPEDARPSRLAWASSSTGGDELFVADAGRAAAWRLTAPGDPVEVALPWPVFDVAPLLTDEAELLYATPISGRTLAVIDLSTGEQVDVNPHREGAQDLELDSHVRGIEAIPMRYAWPELDDDGVQRWGRSVAVSLYSGRMVFAEEGTGCLVRDELGPRTSPGSYGSLDYDTNFPTVGTGPWLERNETNERHVQVSPCGGIASPQSWELRYDRTLQAWEVEGSASGLQDRLAYEDVRYVSDDGEISFTIRAGTTPTQDGWTMDFSVVSGVLEVTGDNDQSGGVDLDEPHLDLLADPVFFWYRVGPADGGWDAVDERPFVLVADEGSNMAGRVEPQTGEIEVVFD